MADTDFDVEDTIDPLEKMLEARAAEARMRALQPSRTRCEECDDAIPEPRRLVLPGVRLCVHCQEYLDRSASRRMAADDD